MRDIFQIPRRMGELQQAQACVVSICNIFNFVHFKTQIKIMFSVTATIINN